jgi:hypothetical protein
MKMHPLQKVGFAQLAVLSPIGVFILQAPLKIAIGLALTLGCFTALGSVVIERRNQNAKAV